MKPSIYYNIPWNSDKNIGKAYNDFMGLLPFDTDYACFVDADASFLTSNYGKQIEDIVSKYPECGLFTVMTNRVKNSKQTIGDWNSNDIKFHRDFAKQLQDKQYSDVEDISDIADGCLSGVVIIIRKSLWRKLGGFSDGFLGVDNDIHIKAYQQFEKLYVMKGVYVYHWYRGGDTSFNPHKKGEKIYLNKKKNIVLNRTKRLKKIIYCAITGDYEIPIVHQLPEGWEYRLYSNKAIPGAFKVENNGLSDVKLARRIKILPWEYFDFDYCLWIDGNTIFDKDKIEALCQSDFVISKHPERDCIYDEGQAIIKFGKDSRENIDAILDRYKKEGFPKNFGLVASHAILRKNTLENRSFCEKWWTEVEANSHRDQMAFNYVLWKNPIYIYYIMFKSIFRLTHIHRNKMFDNTNV